MESRDAVGTIALALTPDGVLIPLPGPGYPLLALGASVFLVGAVIRTAVRRGPRQTS